MDKLQELAALVFITPLYVIATVAIGRCMSWRPSRPSSLLRRSWESQKTKTHGNITSVGRIYTSTSRSGDILETLTMIAANLLYTDKEHEAKVFMYIDGIRGVLSYMKLVKNAGVTLPDYYIVTNGVKEEVAKIHF